MLLLILHLFYPAQVCRFVCSLKQTKFSESTAELCLQFISARLVSLCPISITEQRYQFKRNIVLSLIGCKKRSYFRRQISIKSFGNACSFSFPMSPSVFASFACFLSDIPLTLIMTFKSPSTSQRNS